MDFDASRLRRGELIAAAAAVLLLVSMFLAWYGVSVKISSLGSLGAASATYDAWSAFSVIDLYLLLTVVVALALVVMQATQRSPAVPVSLSVVTTVLGAFAALLILFRIFDPPGIVQLPSGLPAAAAALLDRHLDRTPQVGAFLGLVGAIGITYGGFRSMREEGLSPRDARTQIETVVVGRGRSTGSA